VETLHLIGTYGFYAIVIGACFALLVGAVVDYYNAQEGRMKARNEQVTEDVNGSAYETDRQHAAHMLRATAADSVASARTKMQALGMLAGAAVSAGMLDEGTVLTIFNTHRARSVEQPDIVAFADELAAAVENNTQSGLTQRQTAAEHFRALVGLVGAETTVPSRAIRALRLVTLRAIGAGLLSEAAVYQLGAELWPGPQTKDPKAFVAYLNALADVTERGGEIIDPASPEQDRAGHVALLRSLAVEVRRQPEQFAHFRHAIDALTDKAVEWGLIGKADAWRVVIESLREYPELTAEALALYAERFADEIERSVSEPAPEVLGSIPKPDAQSLVQRLREIGETVKGNPEAFDLDSTDDVERMQLVQNTAIDAGYITKDETRAIFRAVRDEYAGPSAAAFVDHTMRLATAIENNAAQQAKVA
jgi:hypothetical protein